jgi:hypothetical protein
VECVIDLIKFHKTAMEILSGLLEFSPADKQQTKKQRDIARLMRPFFIKFSLPKRKSY